jgi:hypothetical protein
LLATFLAYSAGIEIKIMQTAEEEVEGVAIG